MGEHKFIKNTGWLIFDKILHMTMSLVVTGAVARYPWRPRLWNYQLWPVLC